MKHSPLCPLIIKLHRRSCHYFIQGRCIFWLLASKTLHYNNSSFIVDQDYFLVCNKKAGTTYELLNGIFYSGKSQHNFTIEIRWVTFKGIFWNAWIFLETIQKRVQKLCLMAKWQKTWVSIRKLFKTHPNMMNSWSAGPDLTQNGSLH